MAREEGVYRQGNPWRRIHAIHARSFCRSVLGSVRPSPHQALALAALGREHGAFQVINAQFGAVRVAEGEFVQVALQVLFTAVLVDAIHPSLEDAEESRLPLRQSPKKQIPLRQSSVPHMIELLL